MRAAILAVVLLAGCSAQVAVSAGAATAWSLGLTSAVLIGEELRDADERVPPPALAPDRVVSEQDCTQPIDPAAGNLRCK